METTYPVGLTTEFEGHTVKVTGYHLANGWFAVYRIDEREYDGDTDDLEQDLNYIKENCKAAPKRLYCDLDT